MKSQLLRYFISQELTYLGYCVVIGILVSLNHSFYSALKAFGYTFLVLQPLIIFVNRAIIMELIGKDRDKH